MRGCHVRCVGPLVFDLCDGFLFIFSPPRKRKLGTVCGWKHEASSCVEKPFQIELLGRVTEQVQALKSQAGPQKFFV